MSARVSQLSGVLQEQRATSSMEAEALNNAGLPPAPPHTHTPPPFGSLLGQVWTNADDAMC